MIPNCPSLGREQRLPSVLAKRESASSTAQSCPCRRSSGGLAVPLLSGHLKHKSSTPHFSLSPGGMGKSTRLLAGIYFSFLRGTRTKKPPRSPAASSPADPLARQAINTLSRKQENSSNDCKCRAASGFFPFILEPKGKQRKESLALLAKGPVRLDHINTKQPDAP